MNQLHGSQEPHAPEVADALEELVRQFADPLAFLRELVQNALDAGSNEVEVWTRFEPSPDEPTVGHMTLAVDDYGEGMDRTIIDTKLTRLFSSAKDGDLTRIGKFGIGFVSVFALEPDAVVVDTSRAGESWRLVFRPDRSFVRVARDQPVDGTRIQLIKQVSRTTFDSLRTRARDTLRFWCRHISAPLTFDGEPLNVPFDLPEAVCTVRRVSDGIEAIVGYRSDLSPAFGFYNAGLTLLEGQDATFFPHVAFKLASRTLEHTLSRDNVIRDQHFDRGMQLVRDLVERELDHALLARLRTAPDDDAALAVLARLVRAGHALPGGAADLPLAIELETAERVRLLALRKALTDERLVVARERSALTAALAAQGLLVIAPPAAGVSALLAALCGGRQPLSAASWLLPAPVASLAPYQALLAAARELLTTLDVRIATLDVAHFATDPPLQEHLYLVQRDARSGVPLRLDDDAFRPVSHWTHRDRILLDADLELITHLAQLATREPELAAYILLKLMYLQGGKLSPTLDADLARLAVEHRTTRRGGAP